MASTGRRVERLLLDRLRFTVWSRRKHIGIALRSANRSLPQMLTLNRKEGPKVSPAELFMLGVVAGTAATLWIVIAVDRWKRNY